MEDDDVDRERVRRLLAGPEIETDIVEATSADEAMRCLRARPVDCVLLDFRLGDRVGTDLLQDIRSSADYPCPVIMITGQNDDRSIVTALQKGAYDYLPKSSLQREQLIAAIQGALRWAALKARLQETERSYRRLIECLPQLVWTSTPSGDCDFVSPQWCTYAGTPESELLGLGWLEQVHPEDREAVLKEWTRCVQTAISFRMELRLRACDGSYRWFDSRAIPARETQGRVVKWFGTHTDIHDERQMHQELERQAALIDLIDVAIMTWSRENGVVSWNRGCEELYGYSSAEATGTPVQKLLKTVYSTSEEDHERELTRNLRWSGEVTQTTQSGRSVIVSSRQRFLQFNGRWVVLEANRDITEIKRNEERVLQAQKMEALGTLASGIAHDFNNVLPVVSGNARLARAELEPDHALQETLAEIERASARAADLVRRILQFARQEEVKRRSVQLQDIVADALRLLRRTLPARIQVRSHFARALPCVLADPTQLHQLIMNLATNAAHAIGSDDGVIDFELTVGQLADGLTPEGATTESGDYVTMRVSDSGCGIPTENLRRIFDPFFTTKAAGEGTGLGLSTVHGIVISHGGTITVSSVMGQGTTFHVSLPATHDTNADAGTATHAPINPVVQGKRVMYIDDEVPLTMLMRRALTRLGYDVTTCSDPEEALRTFQAAPAWFDAIITDHSMPRMSGLELACELFKLRPDIPVIVTSGYVSLEDEEKIRAAGVLEIIYKPESIEKASHLLQRLFNPH